MVRLSREEFDEAVSQALTDIPPQFKPYLDQVIVDVEDFPDRRACEAADIDHPSTLLGLYQGTPLTERSVEHSGRLPDRITVYQRNIERLCRTRKQLVRQIRKTVLHEIGHHFGLDEDDLDELGYR
ncbi:MAG: metallopeptidase family protein [Phycisphaerales bacterium]|nr:MAG: metallopeptidase family protein [Phycisphaerales bacterium]